MRGTHEELLDRVCAWAVATFAFTLPFHAIGAHEARRWLPVETCDVPLVATAPLLLLWVVRERRLWLRDGVVLAMAALSCAGVISELSRSSGPAWATVTKHGYGALAVAALTVAARRGHAERVLTSACAGGAIAVIGSLLGYATWFLGVDAFALATEHPIFDGFPRATGTFGDSPQHFGEYLVALLAVTAARASTATHALRRKLRALSVATSLCLLLTFSFAWVGGLVIAVGHLANATAPGTRRWRSVAGIVACVAAMIVASWAMNVGWPAADRANLRAPVPCSRHHVAAVSLQPPMTCHYQTRRWPYEHRLTTYELAKETAAAAFVARPLTGVGHDAYLEFAQAHFARSMGIDGSAAGVYYRTPHSTLLGVPARAGVLGALTLVWLVVAVLGQRERRSRWLWVGAVALLVLGVNVDVERLRHLWLLLGLLATTTPQEQ